MRVTTVSAGVATITTLSLVCMDYIVTKETFDWVLSRPTIVKASDSVFRLMGDFKTYKFEQKMGHTASSIECYMKQYGVSEEEAYKELQKLINHSWKDINRECLKHSDELPKPMLMLFLNYPRMKEEKKTEFREEMKKRQDSRA
ncbi:hypothetical protein ACOSQ2_005908 [Xanthoceras sorbifolium]